MKQFLRHNLLISWLLLIIMLCAPCALAAEGSIGNFTTDGSYTAGQFADVNENKWYGVNEQGVIAKACRLGLMQGTGYGFAPEGQVTLAEAITIAARVHNIYYGSSKVFVQGAPWYQVYLDYAAENGIIAYNPKNNYQLAATRAQMAEIFARALPASELKAINNITSLPDVEKSSSNADSIFLLYNAGVLTGNDAAGSFAPNSYISRAEAAAIIVREALPAERKTLKLQEASADAWSSVYKEAMRVNTLNELYSIMDLACDNLIPSFEVTTSRTVYDQFAVKKLPYFRVFTNITTTYNQKPSVLKITISYELLHEMSVLSFKPAASVYASNDAKYYTEKTDELYQSLAPTGSEYERVKTIHDYMAKNYSYDNRLYNDPNNSDYQESYYFTSLLNYSTGVCQAYSELFYLLCIRAGVDCQIVYGDSNGVGHAWNLVELDGDYYHIDVTFDDPIPDRAGRVYYDYFCLTDSELSADHSWVKADYPAANGTKY
ncbi:MAG: S-layer homology domain-containing protein [Clostridia bacterium]|nr:S-layer homology domain-containing protein [Clostridia bacterium]MDD4798187.1 S-layer homology domain-containing protein [Clostridia bacterium]